METSVRPAAIVALKEWIDAELGRNYRQHVAGHLTKLELEVLNRELLNLADVVEEQSRFLEGRQ